MLQTTIHGREVIMWYKEKSQEGFCTLDYASAWKSRVFNAGLLVFGVVYTQSKEVLTKNMSSILTRVVCMTPDNTLKRMHMCIQTHSHLQQQGSTSRNSNHELNAGTPAGSDQSHINTLTHTALSHNIS